MENIEEVLQNVADWIAVLENEQKIKTLLEEFITVPTKEWFDEFMNKITDEAESMKYRKGSLVIISTQNMHLLKQYLGKDASFVSIGERDGSDVKYNLISSPELMKGEVRVY